MQNEENGDETNDKQRESGASSKSVLYSLQGSPHPSLKLRLLIFRVT